MTEPWKPNDETPRGTPDDMVAYAADLEVDVDNFERFVWPLFEKRGYTKSIAILVHFLALVGSSLEDDGD